MKEAKLNEPKYVEKNGKSLLLILENNIEEREAIRNKEQVKQNDNLSVIQKNII